MRQTVIRRPSRRRIGKRGEGGDSIDSIDRIRIALDAFPTAIRSGLLRILTLPDRERAEAIGEMFQEGITPNLAELLIDLEEEPAIRATVRGRVPETDPRRAIALMRLDGDSG
jgi:hypothetical protein